MGFPITTGFDGSSLGLLTRAVVALESMAASQKALAALILDASNPVEEAATAALNKLNTTIQGVDKSIDALDAEAKRLAANP